MLTAFTRIKQCLAKHLELFQRQNRGGWGCRPDREGEGGVLIAVGLATIETHSGERVRE